MSQATQHFFAQDATGGREQHRTHFLPICPALGKEYDCYNTKYPSHRLRKWVRCLLLKPEKFYGLFGASMVLMRSVFHGFGQAYSLDNLEFARVVGLVF